MSAASDAFRQREGAPIAQRASLPLATPIIGCAWAALGVAVGAEWIVERAGVATPALVAHAADFRGSTALLALHAGADVLCALAYFFVPAILLYFLRTCEDRPFATVFAIVGFFVTACGVAHVVDIWTLWHPDYWMSGAVKLVTAGAAIGTALMLMRIVPRALAAHDSSRLVQMAEQLAHVGHWRLELGTGAMFWSDEIYRTHDLPGSFSPTLESTLARYDTRDREAVSGVISRARIEGTPYSIEARIVRPDGSVRDIVTSGQAQRAADGTIIALFGVFQDITERKDADRERRLLLERVTLATRAGNVGVWEWNIVDGSVAWDASMLALYGLADRSTEITFDVWRDAIHPDDRARALGEINAAIAGGPAFDTEFRIVWADGRVHHIRALATVVRDAAGAAQRIVGTNWDITEVRRLAEELRTANVLAEEASRTKSEFLARMSHEIRTPMNGIIGFTTLLLDSELNAMQRRQLGHIEDSGRALLAIINDILDFSKIEAGKLEIEHIPFSPFAVVDGALSIIRGEAITKGIALDASIDPDIPALVLGDPTRLRQIMLNLLSNALKFTDAGSVRLTLRRVADRDGDLLRCEVSDTGRGVDADRRHLLFCDFSQLDRSTSRNFGGTGLGLAISKRLVEAMGGTIGMQGQPGAGSTFWFTVRLPATVAVATETQTAIDPVAPRRILVVDDNAINQVIVEEMLRRDGHVVVVSADGAAAVDAVLDADFDLILMDMQMPVMGGVEATQRIRALPPPRCHVPIVALTANAMSDQVAACRVAGMNDHLAKPIDRERLRRAIAKWSRPAVNPQAPRTYPLGAAFASVPVPVAAEVDAATPPLGIIELLEVFEDDGAAVADLLNAALNSIRVDAARLERAVEGRDAAETIEVAHRIKGTSGSIRAPRLLEHSAKIERQAKASPPIFDAALLSELRDAIGILGADIHIASKLLRSRLAPTEG